ncbi:ABC transporter permease [Phyllobacterium myrsinacearum]|uniref:Peptide/nickel transport system permease protein n=1 Tax=Phyllobacterium myrsinacearum TaxID=28101 RepID=A0A839EQ93_9HYPH|nr:ABC transporter permease [Phyllobacterium myrsinacearum]MBA8879586.1 peptide/nickel transport system permease protein [Phyllobacterium myrsinacearum]
MTAITADIVAVPRIIRSPGFWHGVIRRLSRDPVALVALCIVIALIAIAILAPYLAPYDPAKTSVIRRLKPIGTPGYLLGTDELGRDMLSRLIYGARLSLVMGVIPVPIAFIIGSTIGIIAGYAGGIVNTLIMRTVDVFYAFPSVLLAVALSGALGSGLTNALVSLTVVFIPQIARVAESVTTQVRRLDYVDAARASGANAPTIIVVHVLSNVLGPIFVFATSLISVSMILASGLSFLGLGVRPPDAEWGLMLNSLRTAIYVNPYVAALPGVMIFVTSICFNLFSDGLRTAMDVKS